MAWVRYITAVVFVNMLRNSFKNITCVWLISAASSFVRKICNASKASITVSQSVLHLTLCGLVLAESDILVMHTSVPFIKIKSLTTGRPGTHSNEIQSFFTRKCISSSRPRNIHSILSGQNMPTRKMCPKYHEINPFAFTSDLLVFYPI